jgi:hypothetical protein
VGGEFGWVRTVIKTNLQNGAGGCRQRLARRKEPVRVLPV